MAHYAEDLIVQRESQKQLTWKTNIEVSSWLSEVNISTFHHGRDFIMVAIPCLALTVLLVEVTCLDGISANAIPYGPPAKTFKVLNLSNQQPSGLREETKICGLLYGLIFTAYSTVRHSSFPLCTLAIMESITRCSKNSKYIF